LVGNLLKGILKISFFKTWLVLEKPHAIGNFTIVINSDEEFLDGYSFSDHKVLFVKTNY